MALAVLGTFVLASCQSYELRPLDPGAHQADWHARTPEVESLRQFLERLELDVRGQAAELDLADGVQLREGRLIALAFNPNLRIARLRVGREAVGAENAGLWADPQLSFSVLRITESVPDPWVITPGLAFSIPLSGRLGAERDLAAAEVVAARAAAHEAEWSVWYEVERAWIDWSAARLRSEETRRAVESMDALVRMVSELAERGEVQRTETSLFRVEQAQRSNQLRGLEGDVAALEQRLRSLMGLAPGAPIELVPALGDVSRPIPLPTNVPDAFESRNPSLARLREEYDVSEDALRREIKKQYPDLTLGPLFESDEGQSRVGFLGAIPVPFLNANRRAIAEAKAEREIARAAFETTYETLVGRYAAASARFAALADQRADMEGALVPLVDQQLADAFELMRLGEGTTLVLLESLTRANQTKLDLINARSAEAAARAEVAFLAGPEAVREPSEATEQNP
jgi:cobalt-zinc-cadmium efflux system outer membrane protein